MKKRIGFKRGYKYQLSVDHLTDTGITTSEAIETDYLVMAPGGMLLIRKGYAWDGPSGPTVDTDSFMRGALVHDALYQLMRAGQLPPECRQYADRLLRRHCTEDGMWRIRAAWVYLAVRKFGKASTKPANRKKVRWAP